MPILLTVLLAVSRPGASAPRPATAIERADATARAYCEAWNAADLPRMRKLFESSRRGPLEEPLFRALVAERKTRCSVVAGGSRSAGRILYANVAFFPPAPASTLYMTESAQIAFDPMIIPHPGVPVGRAIARLASPRIGERMAAEAVLRHRGIPLEGYSPLALQRDYEAAAAKIAQQWKEADGSLDTGYPLSPEDRILSSQ